MTKRIPKAKQQEMTVQIRLDIKPDTPSYYVNYVAVSHTPYDFTLSVTKIPSPPTPEQIEIIKTGNPIPLEAILQIVMPPLLIDGLIKALVDQQTKYEKTLAQQVKKNEIQHNAKQPDSIE